MAETVTLLENRVRKVVERLRELEGLRREDSGRREAIARAADTLERVARELSADLPQEDA